MDFCLSDTVEKKNEEDSILLDVTRGCSSCFPFSHNWKVEHCVPRFRNLLILTRVLSPFLSRKSRGCVYICRQPGRTESRVSIKPWAGCSELADQFISACSSKPCHLHKPKAWLAAVPVSTQRAVDLSLRALKLGGERARAPRTTCKQSWGDSHVCIWCCSGRFLTCSVTRGGLLPATTFGVKSVLFPLSFHAVNIPLAQEGHCWKGVPPAWELLSFGKSHSRALGKSEGRSVFTFPLI